MRKYFLYKVDLDKLYDMSNDGRYGYDDLMDYFIQNNLHKTDAYNILYDAISYYFI